MLFYEFVTYHTFPWWSKMPNPSIAKENMMEINQIKRIVMKVQKLFFSILSFWAHAPHMMVFLPKQVHFKLDSNNCDSTGFCLCRQCVCGLIWNGSLMMTVWMWKLMWNDSLKLFLIFSLSSSGWLCCKCKMSFIMKMGYQWYFVNVCHLIPGSCIAAQCVSH